MSYYKENEIVSIKESIYTSTPTGPFTLTVFGQKKYKRNIKRRVLLEGLKLK